MNDQKALCDAVAKVSWYQCIELPGGAVTPGEYDLRPALERVPIPRDLSGMRCLDVGVRDGFWAFAMEERGAAEVVGIDLDDYADYDWPEPRPTLDRDLVAELERRSGAFAVASQARGSNVKRVSLSVYDLKPEVIGTFDFAFFGTLLLHLRDPAGALMAVRRVLTGELVLNEPFSVTLSLLRRRTPSSALLPYNRPFWSLMNRAGLRHTLKRAGFEVLETGRPYYVPQGPAAPKLGLFKRRSGLGSIESLARIGGGIPHTWFRARPVGRSP